MGYIEGMINLPYAEVIEVHRQKSIAYVARHYKVPVDHVKYVGEVERLPFFWICENHRETFGPIEEPPLFLARPPIIELSRNFEHVDKVLNRKTEIVAGQCLECGKVYMAERR